MSDDDEVVEAEVLDDVRQGYGAHKPTLREVTLREVLRRPAEGDLWSVEVVQAVRVRARNADEAEAIAMLMSNADRVLEVRLVDDERVRRDAFTEGAGDGDPDRKAGPW